MAAPSSARELHLFDAGIASLSELVELPRMLSLRSLNLHCNRVERISHLESLTQLRSLNLSSNLIEVMAGLHTLTQLHALDLSCNRIRLIDGLATLRNLRRLLLSFNRIASLAGLVQCHGGALEHFEAYGNRIALLREAEYLRGLPRLTEVVLRRHGQDNPLCREPGYRERLLVLLPFVRVIDDARTPAGEAQAHQRAAPELPLGAMLSECGVSAGLLGAGGAGGGAGGAEGGGEGGGEGGVELGGLHAKIDSVASLASAAAAAGRGDGGAPADAPADARDAAAPPADAPAALPPTPHIDRTFEALKARRQQASEAAAAAAPAADGGGGGGGGGGAAPPARAFLHSLKHLSLIHI